MSVVRTQADDLAPVVDSVRCLKRPPGSGWQQRVEACADPLALYAPPTIWPPTLIAVANADAAVAPGSTGSIVTTPFCQTNAGLPTNCPCGLIAVAAFKLVGRSPFRAPGKLARGADAVKVTVPIGFCDTSCA